jgi:cell division protein FtsQ
VPRAPERSPTRDPMPGSALTGIEASGPSAGTPKGGRGDLSRRPQRSERAKMRRASRRRKRWIAAGAFMGLLAVGLGAWAMAWRTELLAIREVRISGVEGKLREAVRESAMVPIGLPLVELPSAAIEARVEGIEWVRDARVTPSWPSAVSIVVEPRKPLGRDWATGESIDINGVAFTLPGEDSDRLPVVRATPQHRPDALRALEGLPGDLARRITLVTASTPDDIRFSLANGAVVRWGSVEQGALKAEVLDALLSRRALVYDVSSPLTPTTRGERRAAG